MACEGIREPGLGTMPVAVHLRGIRHGRAKTQPTATVAPRVLAPVVFGCVVPGLHLARRSGDRGASGRHAHPEPAA